MKKSIIILLLMISGMLGLMLSMYTHRDRSVNKDIAHVFHSPVSFVKQIQNDPDAGRKIFNEFCATCHNQQPIIDIHAPLIGDKRIWQALSKQGMPVLLKVTVDGRGAMPARGGCFECSDEQLRAAIQYILKQSTAS
jgi:cytochrome c5